MKFTYLNFNFFFCFFFKFALVILKKKENTIGWLTVSLVLLSMNKSITKFDDFFKL